jgi:GT2 family glycosyltransferase/glycosyltransferase involved in cell wall biosynthesis
MKTVAQRFLKTLSGQLTHARSLRGHVDSVTRHGAHGWAVDTARPGYRPTVEALCDGRIIARAQADQLRPDLAEQGLGDGANGFQLDFPAGAAPDDPAKVTVRLAESGEILFPRKNRAKTSHKSVEGLFELISDDLFVAGWAACPGRDGYRCRIVVHLDGSPVTSGLADMFRPDLLAAGKGDGLHAFRLPLPPGSLTRPVHVVDVLADGHRLARSPKNLEMARLIRPRLEAPRDGRLRLSMSHLTGCTEKAVIRINGKPAATFDWTGERLDWPLPENCLDGRPRVYQAAAVSADLTLVGEPMIFTAPAYTVDLRRATFDGLSAKVTRLDAALPPRVAVLYGEECLGLGVPHGREPNQACLLELDFDRPLPGERARLSLHDRDTGLTVAHIDLVRRHQGLLELSRLAMAADPVAAAPLVGALLETATLAEPDILASTLSCPLPPAPPEPDGAVAVVIPVHSGLEETVACLESVLAAHNDTPSRIILVEDCSPQPALRDYLDALAARALPGWSLLRLPVNRGFPAAANLGLTLAGGRDAVLLNADTVVYDGWLDRLCAAAAQDPRIGTVTPLSNNGEICTSPTICTCLPVADPAVGQAMDAAAAHYNAGRVVDLPVGVGFCLYLKRACLDELGLFDEALWGKGYGEETDFCMRAAARGWRNVLAADCFVIHRGQVSFGPQKLARIRESAAKILQRYPYYDAHIQRFIREDPARIPRQTAALALLREALPRRRVLHVIHSYQGGTERYMRDMAELYRKDGKTSFILRFKDTGEAILSVPVYDQRLVSLFASPHIERYTWQAGAALRQALGFLDLELLHLHAPFGLPVSLLRWLTATFPYVVTVHDYAWLCPRVTLTDGEERYCGEPDADGCRACLSAHGVHPGLARILADTGDIAAYRTLFRDILARAQTVWAGSEDVTARLRRHGFTGSFTVRPHPDSDNAPSLSGNGPIPADGPIRVALFGGLSRIKGADMLAACARAARRDNLPLHFILFGYPPEEWLLTGLENVSVTGRYREEDLDDLVAARRPDIAFFPVQWPETFSYTLSHAFRLGLWPVVSDIGAPAERVRAAGVGTVYPLDTTPEALCALLVSEATRRRVLKAK